MKTQNRTSSAARTALSLLRWSAAAGLAAAAALTVFVGTVRHAALVKSAAQPMGNGQRLSPGFILACGFTATWAAVTAAVFLMAAVVVARRARRTIRQARNDAAAARGGRRSAVRGWGKA